MTRRWATCLVIVLAACSHRSLTLLERTDAGGRDEPDAQPDGGEDGGPDAGPDGGPAPCPAGLRAVGAPLAIDHVSPRHPPRAAAAGERLAILVEDDFFLRERYEPGLVVVAGGAIESRVWLRDLETGAAGRYPWFSAAPPPGALAGVFGAATSAAAVTDFRRDSAETIDLVAHVWTGDGLAEHVHLLPRGTDIRRGGIAGREGQLFISLYAGPEQGIVDGRGDFGELKVFPTVLADPVDPGFGALLSVETPGRFRQPALHVGPDGAVWVSYLTRIDWPWSVQLQPLAGGRRLFVSGASCGVLAHDVAPLGERIAVVAACASGSRLVVLDADDGTLRRALPLTDTAAPLPALARGGAELAVVTAAPGPVVRLLDDRGEDLAGPLALPSVGDAAIAGLAAAHAGGSWWIVETRASDPPRAFVHRVERCVP